MDTWKIPLVIVALLFGVIVFWRVRPLILSGRREARDALRAAKERIESAQAGPERAEALCQAAELVLGGARGAGESAVGYYLRAMRADPTSANVVERAAAGLAKCPRALESLLWRGLAAAPWPPRRAAAEAALRHLVALYTGPLRQPARARSLEHALALLLLDAAAPPPDPAPPATPPAG
jgi:hypothetical protein